MKNEEQKLYQIGEYVRICRKKKLSDCSETVIKRAGKHRDGDKNIRFYIYVTKNNIYVI